MNFARIACFALVVSGVTSTLPLAAAVHAQEVPKGTASNQGLSELDPHYIPPTRSFRSPERFLVELRGGPYSVFSGKEYGNYFSDDSGPLLSLHLDAIAYRIPDMLYLTGGFSFGWMNFSGDAIVRDTGETSTEETTLTVLPMMLTAGLRFDLLPRRLGVPLILAARAGFEFAHWTTGTGARTDASGWSVGPVLSAQLALDLDTFESGGARALDEEWGINHSYLFAEMLSFFPVSKSLDIGTTTWLLGLGFIF
jgi:hypothetical protein